MMLERSYKEGEVLKCETRSLKKKMKFQGLRESTQSSTSERISQDESSIMTGGREEKISADRAWC